MAVYAPDLDAIRADVEALAAMTRDSAGPGERAAAEWAAGRLRAAGSAAGTAGYRGRATYAWSFAGHGAAGLLALRLGGPRGALLALAALASLERDASGRAPWRRRRLGGGHGANALARIPARGPARRTAIVVAHLDAARTGLVWSPQVVEHGAERHLRTRRVEPVMGLQAVGLLATAAACVLPGRARAPLALGAALIDAAAVLLNLDIARSPVVPGANDNATGVAAALDLARALVADPLEHTEVLIALVGSEETGMAGFHAVLEAERPEPGRSLVLSLDTLGCGTPIVAAAEGAVATHRYREADLELAETGARLAGEAPPERWRIGGWTDPLLALTRGIPAISLLSMGPGYYPHYHHPSDRPEFVDWECVGRCARIAHGTLRAADERSG
jgi:hypothetical protein